MSSDSLSKSCNFKNVIDLLLLFLSLCTTLITFWTSAVFPDGAFFFQSMALFVLTGLSCATHCLQCLSIIRTIGGVAIFVIATRNRIRNMADEANYWQDVQWYMYIYLANIILVVVFGTLIHTTCANYSILTVAQAFMLMATGMFPIHSAFNPRRPVQQQQQQPENQPQQQPQ